MKLIWFSHFVPFPPRGGSLQRSFNLIRQASRFCEIHLFALNLQGESVQRNEEYRQELKKYCRNVEICEPPFPWRSGRWWLEAATSPFLSGAFSSRALFSNGNLARLERLLAAHPDALVHFDSIDLGLYADAAKGFRRVLNHHNCESAMAGRQAANEKNPIQRIYLRQQAGKLAEEERSLCASFDLNLVVSEQDRQLLSALQPEGSYHLVENGVDTEYFRPATGIPEPHSVIFTGLLGWRPNVSAIEFMVQNVWPVVKKRFPDSRLYLAGKNPPQLVLDWPKQDTSITVVPNPEDMRPWLAMGKPVVSTTIGCEGLRVTPGKDILVADCAADFAARIGQIFENEKLRRCMSIAGRMLVEREYSWGRIGRQLEEAYCRALSGGCRKGGGGRELHDPGVRRN